MRYLLIDFGATYVKCALYSDGVIVPTVNIPSPFQSKTQVARPELISILESAVDAHQNIEGIFICTILGGKWELDTYKSWKCLSPGDRGTMCMISGLFNSEVVHIDHKEFTKAQDYTHKPLIIGYVRGIPLYSPMGDTNCVIRSLSLPKKGVAINMGTGSQVISETEVIRFYPAGRSFLVFDRLFDSSSLSLFDVISTLSIQDVKDSSLIIDLAVFEQARSWSGGGAISGITEANFSMKNIAASLLKAFVLQYEDSLVTAESVTLVGGIANKIAILPELFQVYYPNKSILYESTLIEATHKGIGSVIKTYEL